MKEMVRYGTTLAIICIVASGLLVGINSLTKPRILAQAQSEEEASLKEVMPQGEKFEPVKSGDEIIYYKALDKDGKLLGVAFKTSDQGYSSVIEVMSGMLIDGTVTAIKVLSHNETPGLGSKVAEKEFAIQFKGAKNLDNVQAVTGATISSRAIIDSVKKRIEKIKELLKG